MEAALLYCSALTDNIVKTGSLKDLIQMSIEISENLLDQCDCGKLFYVRFKHTGM